MTNQFHELADRLADLYRAGRGIQIELAHQETDLETRVLILMPNVEGWPGKNEEQRKTARALAVAGDATCHAIEERISELRDDLADNSGETDALREQRDALRWTVTERLSFALEAKHNGRKEIAVNEAIEEATA